MAPLTDGCDVRGRGVCVSLGLVECAGFRVSVLLPGDGVLCHVS